MDTLGHDVGYGDKMLGGQAAWQRDATVLRAELHVTLAEVLLHPPLREGEGWGDGEHVKEGLHKPPLLRLLSLLS